jgi:hypothetical protein
VISTISEPAQLNVLADESRYGCMTNFKRPENSSSTHYLPAEATFVTPYGLPAAKYAQQNRTEVRASGVPQNAMTVETTSTIPSAGKRAYGSASANH